ncbi:MAG: hypothetical protein NC913_01250 [Candidatus Omnitrophica bacterium]|nr:hypothetical protein [Candidatus Omnitrophota bacterium]
MGKDKDLVSVAIDIPEKKLFTYRTTIPVEIGQRVRVPFGKRIVQGWVVGPGISGDYDYKNIIKVYDEKPIINEFLMKLAVEMAANYFTSVGNVLGAMNKNLSLKKIPPDFKSEQTNFYTSKYTENTIFDNILDSMKSKSTLLAIVKFASIEKKKKFFLDLSGSCRGSCVIAFSNLIDVNRYSALLESAYGRRVIVFTSELNKTEKSIKWKRMIEEKNLIITGTRISLFSPVSDLAIVVVDEPSEYGHKENQQPRYNSKEVALMISKILNVPVLFTVFQPDVADMHMVGSSKALMIEIDKEYQLPQVLTSQIRMKSQKDFLTDTSKHLLEKNVIEKKKVVIIHNIKGYARVIICKKCGNVFVCENCGNRAVPVSESFVYCIKCKMFTEIPAKCPDCKKGSLITRQPGIRKIFFALKSLYPDLSISLISEREKIDIGSDIFLGTQHIVNYLEQISPGLLIFANADTIAAGSRFRSEEKFFLLVEKIKRMMCGKENTIIIQTRNPGLDVYIDVAKNNYENFYKRELSIRKKLMFPPFGELIEICFSGRNWGKNKNFVFDELKKFGEIYEVSPKEKEDTVWWKVLDRKIAFEILQSVIDKYRITKISLDTTPYF